MIHLTVILTAKNEADVPKIAELLQEQSRLTKQEPGCVRFEVYHSQEDPKLFILNERWESQSALDIHRKARACSEIYFPQVVPLVDRVPHPCDLIQ
ncbi:MAG TPA: antibiotic biosynthesis monooxygenase [Planctomycetaceae bacterium]|nr:antibiotic biosynthesis monooxygenase [Planctomycetaceae bacterium]